VTWGEVHALQEDIIEAYWARTLRVDQQRRDGSDEADGGDGDGEPAYGPNGPNRGLYRDSEIVLDRDKPSSGKETERWSGDGDNRAARRLLKFTLYRDIDPTPRKHWLVANFLGRGDLSCVFGAPGSGKSCLVVDLAGHIGAGMEWFGRRASKGAVLIVVAERAKLTERRLAAFRQHHRLDDLPIAVVSGPVDLRSSPEQRRPSYNTQTTFTHRQA
jgi:hypothetical protein